MAPIALEPIDTGRAIRMFGHVMGVTAAIWRATSSGRLSRFVQPPPEVDETMRALFTDFWRSITAALRDGSEQVSIVLTSLEPDRLVVASEALGRLSAFLPYVREAGIDLPEDPESEQLYLQLLAAAGEAASAVAEAAAERYDPD